MNSIKIIDLLKQVLYLVFNFKYEEFPKFLKENGFDEAETIFYSNSHYILVPQLKVTDTLEALALGKTLKPLVTEYKYTPTQMKHLISIQKALKLVNTPSGNVTPQLGDEKLLHQKIAQEKQNLELTNKLKLLEAKQVEQEKQIQTLTPIKAIIKRKQDERQLHLNNIEMMKILTIGQPLDIIEDARAAIETKQAEYDSIEIGKIKAQCENEKRELLFTYKDKINEITAHYKKEIEEIKSSYDEKIRSFHNGEFAKKVYRDQGNVLRKSIKKEILGSLEGPELELKNKKDEVDRLRLEIEALKEEQTKDKAKTLKTHIIVPQLESQKEVPLLNNNEIVLLQKRIKKQQRNERYHARVKTRNIVLETTKIAAIPMIINSEYLHSISQNDYIKLINAALGNLYDGVGKFKSFLEQNQLKCKLNKILFQSRNLWQRTIETLLSFVDKLIFTTKV